LRVCGYPRVPTGFKKTHGYFLSGYLASKQAGNKWIFFFAGQVAGRHYPYPTRPVAIPNNHHQHHHLHHIHHLFATENHFVKLKFVPISHRIRDRKFSCKIGLQCFKVTKFLWPISNQNFGGHLATNFKISGWLLWD